MQKKYLFLGPKKNVHNSELTGGIIVLFENLLNYCDEHHISYDVIDTNKANYKTKLYAYVQILLLLLKKTPRATHVSLHGTANDYLFIAPFSLLVAKSLGKHFSLRKFAGNFIEIYENYSAMQQMIIRMTLKYSSCNFFETKYLVEYFKKFNFKTFWFPNVRKKSLYYTDKKFHKRFIYIGAIREEKGIDILCEVSNLLSREYTIDLYGNLDEKYTKHYFDNYNVNYKGSLNNEDVTQILSKYDVLILPSLREGYPGVIIEALSVGLPIIATNLKGILEMIDSSSSIFIYPANVEQLKNAIKLFNEKNYLVKVNASMNSFVRFDSEIQTAKYLKRIGRQ